MKKHTAPILAAVPLLLPVLYVGSYLALVVPNGQPVAEADADGVLWRKTGYYRAGGRHSRVVYWPLEQIDRKVRPGAWGQTLTTEIGELNR